MTVLEITIPGDPVPQGSMRAYGSNVVHMDSARLRGFRSDIRLACQTNPAIKVITGPVVLRCTFVFRRPDTHYLPANTKRATPALRLEAPAGHVQRPDIDKLLRAVADALTGQVYADDSQIVEMTGHKVWGDTALTSIEVRG